MTLPAEEDHDHTICDVCRNTVFANGSVQRHDEAKRQWDKKQSDITHAKERDRDDDDDDDEVEKKVFPGLPHHVTIHSVEQSAGNGCQVCRVYLTLGEYAGGFLHSNFTISGPPDSWHIELQGFYTSKKKSGEQRMDFAYIDAVYVEGQSARCNLIKAAHSCISTGDEAVTKLAQHWLSTCIESHDRCRKPKQGFYPSRLIDISRAHLRLIDTAIEKPSSSYATLSHCWGGANFFKLTKRSRSMLESGFDARILPATFQDAILTAQKLGICYIWIDSLCILQVETNFPDDSADALSDWRTESTKMKHIYANSLLNIGATDARNPDEGCFRKRSLRDASPYPFISWAPLVETEKAWYCVSPRLKWTADAAKDLFDRPLFQRAWVMQERLLSSRMLHYAAADVFWECNQRHACFEMPRGLGGTGPEKSTFSLQGVTDYSENQHGSDKDSPRENFDGLWYNLLSNYTKCALTYPEKDSLVALGGIAEYLAEATGREYIAGFWMDTLTHDLLWGIQNCRQRPIKRREGIPSWHWASLNGEVGRLMSISDYDVLFTIRNVDFDLADGSNKYGQLRSASLSLRARRYAIKLRRRDLQENSHAWWIALEDSFARPMLGSKLFLMLDDAGHIPSEDGQPVTLMPLFKSEKSGMILGLMLKRVSLRARRYARLGVFATEEDWEGKFEFDRYFAALSEKDVELV